VAVEGPTYNGWPSYETWLVHLWLSNDPDTEATCRELVSAERTVDEAAEALKAYIEGASPLADGASVYTDLLGAALGRVDWRAVAEHFSDHFADPRGRQGSQGGAGQQRVAVSSISTTLSSAVQRPPVSRRGGHPDLRRSWSDAHP